MPLYGSANKENRRRAGRAFTLVELLVVMSIIIVLAGSVIVAVSSVVNKAKARNTSFMLNIVRDAVEEFKREQTEKPTIVRARQGDEGKRVSYKKRYGLYPPDELELFTSKGLPGCAGDTCRSLAPGKAEVIPEPGRGYPAMKFYTVGIDAEPQHEHRDLAAMVLAIELLSESAGMILDGIPEANRSPGPLDSDGNPVQFLDRGEEGWDDQLQTSREDHQIRYIVDSWGVPITYLSQRDFDLEDLSGYIESSNDEDWNQASTEMIALNAGQPIIMSYGPDGPDQLTREMIEEGSEDSVPLVRDWVEQLKPERQIDNPLNEDNIYADPSLKEKLATGIGED